MKLNHRIVKMVAPKLYREWSLPRPMIRQLMGKPIRDGAEIGVLDGSNALSILQNTNVEMLWLVDPYHPYTVRGETFNPKPFKKIAQKKLEKYKNRIYFANTPVSLPHGLDFVYIDANHRYMSVKRDIELYFESVKSGGLIGGHDFTPVELGVVEAVKEFALKNNLKLHGEGGDWWVMKP